MYVLSKHEALARGWANAGTPSTTLAHGYVGPMSCLYRPLLLVRDTDHLVIDVSTTHFAQAETSIQRAAHGYLELYYA